jgi:hypothetical protein
MVQPTTTWSGGNATQLSVGYDSDHFAYIDNTTLAVASLTTLTQDVLSAKSDSDSWLYSGPKWLAGAFPGDPDWNSVNAISIYSNGNFTAGAANIIIKFAPMGDLGWGAYNRYPDNATTQLPIITD